MKKQRDDAYFKVETALYIAGTCLTRVLHSQ